MQLGRLLFSAIPTSLPESTSMAMNLPAVKGIETDYFVLVLNGSESTPWSALAEKVIFLRLYIQELQLMRRQLYSWRNGTGPIKRSANARRREGYIADSLVVCMTNMVHHGLTIRLLDRDAPPTYCIRIHCLYIHLLPLPLCLTPIGTQPMHRFLPPYRAPA